MDTVLALLLNIVYGFLFFVAFGVLIITTGVFGLAFWDKVGRPLVRRLRGVEEQR